MRGCVPLLGMSPPRRYLPPAVLAITLIVAPLSACSSSPKPQPTASAYLADWGRQDWTAMRALTDGPPADFTSVNQAAFSTLSVRQASITAGTMATNGTAASEPITERLTLTGLGAITFSSTLHLVQQQGKWLVQWSPATITPQLRPGDQLSLRVTWPARAPILGAGGTPLTTQGPVVTIGVEGAWVKSAASLASALVTAGATAQQASSAITAAKAHPTFFEPVFTVSRSRYNQLAPAIYPILGTVFQSSTALTAATPGLTSGVVGTVGPVTAQELGQLGTPYSAQSVVGQTGLEQADERRLAGTPGATVAVVTKNGAQVATVTTLPAHPGTAVSTTIKESVQRAAEAALAGEKKSAALVALDASTGDVLAAVSVNAGGFDQAIDGGFPPGSTFKVITSTALINRGFGPQSAASCPSTATVDGEVFHNAESEAPVSTMLQGFTESCNTAFINLAAGGGDVRAGQTPADRADGVRRLGPLAVGCGRPGRHRHRAGPGPGLAAGHGNGRRSGRYRDRANAAPSGGEPGRGGDRAAVRGGRPGPARDDGLGGGAGHRGRAGPAGRHLRQDRDRRVRDEQTAQDRRLADGLQGQRRLRGAGGGFRRERRPHLRPDRGQVPGRALSRLDACRGPRGQPAVDLGLPPLLVRLGGKARVEGVARQPGQLLVAEPELPLYRGHVVVHVPAEVRRIVAVHGRERAGVQHAGQHVLTERGDHAERHVPQRAHGQRDLLVAQPGHQLGVFHGPHPVVDALHVELVKRAAHVVRTALLARVRDQSEPFGRRYLIHPGEQGRRVTELGRVEPDADEAVAERKRGPQHRVGGLGPQVAQEAQDQVGGDAVLLGPLGQRGGQPAEDLFERNPVGQGGLPVEEDLGPAHPRRRGTGHVGAGRVVEVLLDLQHAQVPVVQVEKGLQAVERVLGTQFLDVQHRHPGAISCRELDQQLGLKRALDVNVQLGNRQHVSSPSPRPRPSRRGDRMHSHPEPRDSTSRISVLYFSGSSGAVFSVAVSRRTGCRCRRLLPRGPPPLPRWPLRHRYRRHARPDRPRRPGGLPRPVPPAGPPGDQGRRRARARRRPGPDQAPLAVGS